MKSLFLTSFLLLAVAVFNCDALPRTKLQVADTSLALPVLELSPFPLPLPTAKELTQILLRAVEYYKDFDYNPIYLLTSVAYAFSEFYLEIIDEIFGYWGGLEFLAHSAVLVAVAVDEVYNLFLDSPFLGDLEILLQDVYQRGEVIAKPFLTALVTALEDGKVTALEQLRLTTLATLALPKLTALVTEAYGQFRELLGEQSETIVNEILRILETAYNDWVALFPEQARKLLV